MKKVILVILVLVFSCKNSPAQKKSVTSEKEIMKITKEVYSSLVIYSNTGKGGSSQSYELSLTSDNKFKYRHVDIGGCSSATNVSYGRWLQKGDAIKLIVADSLSPVVSFKKEFLKKNIVTVFFRSTAKNFLETNNFQPEDYFSGGHMVLHSEGKKEEVCFGGLRPNEFSISKGISKLELFIPNTNFKTNYFEVKIPENTGQIFIENLSRDVITDFSSYKITKKNDTIKISHQFGGAKFSKGIVLNPL